MSNNSQLWKQIEQLQGLSKTLLEKVKVDTQIVDLSFEAVMQSEVSEDDKGQVEKMKANMNKIITLSKEGRQTEVQELIKNLQNECQNKK